MGQENKFIKSLITNAQQGKLVALEELFELNLNQTYTLLLRLTGNKSVAELLTQKSLVTAWKEIKKNGPDDITFSEWLKNIAIKITKDNLKSNTDPKRRKKAKKDQQEGSSSKSIEQAIASLDDEPRIILVLNKIENRSFTNISQLLNKPESDIEEILSDAIEQISNSLDDDESSTNIYGLSVSIRDEFEADIEVLQRALDEIMEIRFEETKESKSEIEARELEEFRQYEESKREGRKKERKKKEKRKKEAATKKKRNIGSIKIGESKFNKKILLRMALPVLIAGFFIYSFTSTESWKVYSTLGDPLLNKEPFSESINFSPGDLITVDEVSSAIIEMPGIGRIKVFNGTSVKRLEKDNSCRLLGGKLAINALRAKENLSLVVPDATIQGFQDGVDYSVQVDKRGNSVIDVDAGWLLVSSGNNVTIFPKNYSLRILNGGGVSIPHYSNSGSNLNTLLEEYLFNGKRGMTLNRILELSTNKESITLWNLLQRVKPKHRNVVYEKLYALVPHSDSVTKNDLLDLAQDPLQIWFEEIEWSL